MYPRSVLKNVEIFFITEVFLVRWCSFARFNGLIFSSSECRVLFLYEDVIYGDFNFRTECYSLQMIQSYESKNYTLQRILRRLSWYFELYLPGFHLFESNFSQCSTKWTFVGGIHSFEYELLLHELQLHELHAPGPVYINGVSLYIIITQLVQ